jgi:thymidylate synthase (FAD)
MKVISVTPNAEEIILYIARVSNPANQNSGNTKLIRYLLDNKHWSPFEMADLTIEVATSRAISAQMLRHRSFHFQEFSQRYASVDSTGLVLYAARRQDVKNRQNSFDDLSEEIKQEWEDRQNDNWKRAFEHYTWALNNSIAKECARMVLPMQTGTRLYMKGTVRDWIFYILVRTDPTSQKEHRDIAEECKKLFCLYLPTTAEALGWI